jgi:CYTH domain-containing protein
MSLEIERKFLVKNDDFKKASYQQKTIKQGYLCNHQSNTVRVRIADETGFLTIKGPSNESGTTRFEWEKEIDKNEAEELLLLCEPSIIDKTRYLVKNHHLVFEVDVFYGDNLGLLIAEIELSSEDEAFDKPAWLGKEVTGIEKYYNSKMSKNPFKNW